jgi:hypothetical protein
MSQIDRKRIETYTEHFDDSDTDGMSLRVRNTEGGGSSVPDESEFYERRYQWLKSTNGGNSDNIWINLAKGVFNGKSFDGDNSELVYINIPGWLVKDDDDLGVMFPHMTGGQTLNTFAELKTESSKDSDAYAFGNMYNRNRGVWVSPQNMYSTAWVAKKCCTLYVTENEPRPVDCEEIKTEDALDDNIDVFNADEDDYDWRIALGAAYRRSEGSEQDKLSQARENAKELPDKLFKKVEVGVDEYMRRREAKGEDIKEDELATFINSISEALRPGTVKDSNL